MKKILFIFSSLLFLSACRPEARNGEESSSIDSEIDISSEKVPSKSFELKLFKPEIKDVEKSFSISSDLTGTSELEGAGHRYEYASGEEIAVKPGSIQYYNGVKKYNFFYSPELEVAHDLPDSAAYNLIQKTLSDLDLDGITLKAYKAMTKEEIIDELTKYEGGYLDKEGKEVGLENLVNDTEFFLFSKSYDGLELFSQRDLVQREDLINASIYFVAGADGIYFADMSTLPNDIVKEESVDIYSEDYIREKVNEYLQDDLYSDKKITNIDLCLVSEPVEMIEVFKRDNFIYKPSYFVELSFEEKKGEETYQAKDYLIFDGQSGEVLE